MDTPSLDDLSDAEWATLDGALAALTLPTDASWLDGYIAGLTLLPEQPEWSDWAAKALGSVPLEPLIQTLSQRRLSSLSQALAQKAWWDPFLRASLTELEDPHPEAMSEVLMPWAAGLEQALHDFPIEAFHNDPSLMLVLARIYRHLPAPDEQEREVVELLNHAYPLDSLEDAVDELTACVSELWELTHPAAG